MLALSFLSPLASLFVLAAGIPLAALALTERRAARIRSLLGLAPGARRALVPPVAALVMLAVLVGIAAAQPVVVRAKRVGQRSDAQAWIVLDTSLSMSAAAAPHAPSRLARAKRIALELEQALPGVPVGIASMTDRVLPDVLPTVDEGLFRRTLAQSVGIDQPPPSEPHKGRATTFDALGPVATSHFFSPDVRHRLLVVLTDGESARISPVLKLDFHHNLTGLFVHVWAPGERIFDARGRAVAGYRSDPASADDLRSIASITGGRVYEEHELGPIEADARASLGPARTQELVAGYGRIPLAPWLVLAGVVPLGFLLRRRNL
jgi:hypothetical protein